MRNLRFAGTDIICPHDTIHSLASSSGGVHNLFDFQSPCASRPDGYRYAIIALYFSVTGLQGNAKSIQ